METSVTSSQSRASYFRPVVEWAIWSGFSLLAYSQTALFDQTIPEYRFDANGWPRAICVLIFIGATLQLLLRCLEISRRDAGEEEVPAGEAAPLSAVRMAQRAAIFLLPLAYLYLVPSIGFYVATPVLVAVLMIVLEVRSVKVLASVTAIVTLTFLIIFTRYFYVALPVGNAPLFYEMNNAIVGFVRTGM